MNSVNYFDTIADQWNVIRSEYFEEKLKYIALSKANIKNKICADLGCGAGFISLALSMDSKIVFSIDTSKNMLKEIHKNIVKENKNNIYLVKGSMEEIPLFDSSIDVVFTNMALHHVPDAKKAIQEMYRVLKKNGTVVISDVEEHTGAWARTEMHDEWLGFSHSQLEDWLRAAGFKKIEIASTDLSCKGYSSQGEYTETGIFIATATKEEE